MPKFNESYCLAILLTNLKKRKRYPDSITVADCAKYLFEAYGSINQVAQMVGVSESVIRKWVNLADAPKVLRQYVKEGRIYPVAAFTILSAFGDTSKVIAVTEEVVDWGEADIVRLIRCIKSHPRLSIKQCTELLYKETMDKLLQNN